MRRFLILALLLLSACSRPAPPVGRWEGGYENNGDLVAARVEILPNATVRVMAPDLTNVTASQDEMAQMRARLAAELANGWSDVAPRPFDFDGTTFRKPGGVAAQMVWNKSTNEMTLELYIGRRPALAVPLRPVEDFHDDPWASG